MQITPLLFWLFYAVAVIEWVVVLILIANIQEMTYERDDWREMYLSRGRDR